ncbi:MAG: FtsX-like permease family protein, partial [Chloroflexota bacterium]
GIAENQHTERYTIVGILGRSNTAYDTAVYTQLESMWDAHEHEDDNQDDDETPFTIGRIELQEVGGAAEREEVTAVLVLPTGFSEQIQIAQQFYLAPTLQAAFPGQELSELIGILNQGQQALNLIGYLVLGIAGLTIFLSMYSAILARRQALAIMRSLGSTRLSIFRMTIFETLLISLIGAVLGRILGYGLAMAFAYVFSIQNAIPMPVRFLWDLEAVLWVLSIGVGLLAGLIPAWMAYRVNVVDNLFPS